jgi:hypothetical protein
MSTQNLKVKSKKLVLFSLVITALIGCNKMGFKAKEDVLLTSMDYIRWVENEENGLKILKDVGEFTFSLQYKPLDYITLMNVSPGTTVTQQRMDSARSQISDMEYYTFSIKVNGFNDELLKYNIKDMKEYYYRVEYFSFIMQQNISMLSGKDTIPCALYHFERSYGISPEAKMVLGFPNMPVSNDRVFICNDEVLGTGTIKLTIEKENIIHIPNLLIQ